MIQTNSLEEEEEEEEEECKVLSQLIQSADGKSYNIEREREMNRRTGVIGGTKTQKTKGEEIVPERRLTEEELLGFKQTLEKDRESAERCLEENRRIERDPDGSSSWAESQRLSVQIAQGRLGRSEAALGRMEKKSYGICGWPGCGRSIDLERLLICPTTEYCVAHQAEAERRNGRKR